MLILVYTEYFAIEMLNYISRAFVEYYTVKLGAYLQLQFQCLLDPHSFDKVYFM